MKRISMIILLIGIFFSVSAQIKIYNATTEEAKGDQLGVLIGKEIFLTDKNGVKGEKVGEYKDDGNLYYVTNRNLSYKVRFVKVRYKKVCFLCYFRY